jgi:hypothetical protein
MVRPLRFHVNRGLDRKFSPVAEAAINPVHDKVTALPGPLFRLAWERRFGFG